MLLHFPSSGAGKAAGPTMAFPVDNAKLPDHRQVNMWIENTCQLQDSTRTANRLQSFQSIGSYSSHRQSEPPLTDPQKGETHNRTVVCWLDLLALRFKTAFLLVC